MIDIDDDDTYALIFATHKLAKGLLEIAELAMPDTYFQSDSRCKLARKMLKQLKKLKR